VKAMIAISWKFKTHDGAHTPQILVEKGHLSIVLFNVSFHNKFVLRSSISAKLKASSQFE
jgi:hypothetical protein